MKRYLEVTKLVNYKSVSINRLIEEKHWNKLNTFDKIHKIYNFVKDDIAFGYNEDDAIPADRVLTDGYGQCNTKGTLFMALLRGVGIPCRLHGFTINKKMQFGAIRGLYYLLSPSEIIHVWVEVLYEDKWYNLEGLILDNQYLSSLQQKFKECQGDFCGYGVGTNKFQNPEINWNGNDTYIQKEGIVKDLGIYDNPDIFFNKYTQKINGFKRFMFQKHIRHLMNRNVNKIRNNLYT